MMERKWLVSHLRMSSYARRHTASQRLLIADANPKTFTGTLNPANFCIALKKTDIENANAKAESGLVTVDTGLLKAVKNDAQLAGILAHELAHVALHHVRKSVSPRVRSLLTSDQIALYDSYLKLMVENAAAYAAFQKA